MSQIKQILIPLDGSSLAEAPILPALRLAESLSATVTLLRVVPTLEMMAPFAKIKLSSDGAQKEQQRLAKNYLQGVRIMHKESPVTIKTAVTLGRPAKVINQFIEENGVDLLMISSHGGSGIGRWRYGGVAMKLLLTAPCSTLIMRVDKPERPLSFERILVLLDGSKESETAVDTVTEMTKQIDATLFLFRTAPPIHKAVGKTQADQLLPELQTQIDRYLKTISQKLKKGRATIKTNSGSGPIVQSILAQAQEKQVDLIVFSPRGATGDEDFPLGRVADKVVRGAKRSLLLVR